MSKLKARLCLVKQRPPFVHLLKGKSGWTGGKIKINIQMNVEKELENAVLLGDLITIRSLIKKGSNIEVKDKYGRTAIFDAIVKGFHEIVLELCLANINVNIQDKNGKTPLHFAAIYSQYEIAKILIQFGAEVDLKDENGNTPLSDAVFYSHGIENLIIFLQQKGADPTLKNNYDVSPKNLAESIANYDLSHLFNK